MNAEFPKPPPSEARDYFTEKMTFTTGPVEVNRALKGDEPINVVDVRAAEDFEKGHVPGAKNLPKERWSDTSVLRHNCVNVIYCYSQQCHLAAKAALEFADQGYSVMEMDGGFEAWKQNDLPIEK